jgi:phenylacetate-CoA ligase
VREHAEVAEFQIVLTREEGIRDEITVQVELEPGHDGRWPELERRLGADLAHAHEGLRFNIARAKQGELPRFELKAKRLQDRRQP